MTVIVDYGVGNLFSLVSSLEKIGEKAIVSSCSAEFENADRIILPGVGAFCDAERKLRQSGTLELLLSAVRCGKPVLGICLGMQLLFDRSLEYGENKGLGLISGDIVPISDKVENLKIPHMGWNALDFKGEKHPLFKYINNGDCVYFVHSFCADNCEKNIIATTEYGCEITAAVAKNNLLGCQFHPEKSGNTGLAILRAFCEMKEGAIC